MLIIYLHLAKKCDTKLKPLGFTFFIKNLASLFFAFNFNFTSRISRYKNLKVIKMKKLKLMCQSFWFYPTPNTENSKISEISLLLKSLTLVETQDLKQKNELRQKLKGHNKVHKKWTFPRFQSFWFCPIPKIKNSEILQICLLL